VLAIEPDLERTYGSFEHWHDRLRLRLQVAERLGREAPPEIEREAGLRLGFRLFQLSKDVAEAAGMEGEEPAVDWFPKRVVDANGKLHDELIERCNSLCHDIRMVQQFDRLPERDEATLRHDLDAYDADIIKFLASKMPVSVTQEDMAEIASRATIGKHLNKLVGKGVVRRVGTKGGWTLTEVGEQQASRLS
jgi:hypothetical protein